MGERAVAFTAAYLVDDLVYLPVEAPLTELGAKVAWGAESRRLTVRWGEHIAAVSQFSHYALIDANLLDLGAAPRVIDGHLCVPEKFFTLVVPRLADAPATLADLAPVAPPVPAPDIYVAAASPGRHHLIAVRRLVLDAGHGGHDPGAKSPQGIREKSINLALVRRLAERLRRETDVEVVLTRRDDTFVPLGGRTARANASGADLFISIHANGAYRRAARGFEVYFLSLQSSDDRAARLAAAENGPRAAESPFSPGGGEGGDIDNILSDMIRTENLAASERLAVLMQERLDLAMNMENRGVKQAPFYVLAGAQMPAVLIEVGFVSNPDEAAELTRSDVQKRIVDSLFDAILYYDARAAAGE